MLKSQKIIIASLKKIKKNSVDKNSRFFLGDEKVEKPKKPQHLEFLGEMKRRKVMGNFIIKCL